MNVSLDCWENTDPCLNDEEEGFCFLHLLYHCISQTCWSFTEETWEEPRKQARPGHAVAIGQKWFCFLRMCGTVFVHVWHAGKTVLLSVPAVCVLGYVWACHLTSLEGECGEADRAWAVPAAHRALLLWPGCWKLSCNVVWFSYTCDDVKLLAYSKFTFFWAAFFFFCACCCGINRACHWLCSHCWWFCRWQQRAFEFVWC